jgi:hypothetical protein
MRTFGAGHLCLRHKGRSLNEGEKTIPIILYKGEGWILLRE